MDNPKKLNKIEQLKIHLKADLHRLISVNTHFHGIKTFEIGEFLDTQTVCEKCKADMPAWHKDQLVHPVMTALTKMAAEQEREKKEAATKREMLKAMRHVSLISGSVVHAPELNHD